MIENDPGPIMGGISDGDERPMKVKVDIDCTPLEARVFFGLPDVQPMQEKVMAEIEARMLQALQATDPETLIKTWMPAGMAGFEQLQKMFWNQFTAAAGKGGQ